MRDATPSECAAALPHDDVRVVQRWTGRWSLGGASGTLDGLETEALIEDFEVRQLQAVRNF